MLDQGVGCRLQILRKVSLRQWLLNKDLKEERASYKATLGKKNLHIRSSWCKGPKQVHVWCIPEHQGGWWGMEWNSSRREQQELCGSRGVRGPYSAGPCRPL